MKTFLWIEDRRGKASYTFWKEFLTQIFPEVELESKRNSSELVKAVKNLNDSENKYIIVFDNSFDNLQAVMEQKTLAQFAAIKENVVLMDIICFEYILLEFKDLMKWIYAPEDEFLNKRAGAIKARESLVKALSMEAMDYKKLKEILEYDEHIEQHNIEQLAAKLLFDLTRNTGFEVSKGNLGDCWIKSCCEWDEREEDDICGLDYSRLTIYDKMRCIYEGTCLKTQFTTVGLEVTQ